MPAGEDAGQHQFERVALAHDDRTDAVEHLLRELADLGGTKSHNFSNALTICSSSRGWGGRRLGVVTKVHSGSPSKAFALAGSAVRSTPCRCRSRSSATSARRGSTLRLNRAASVWLQSIMVSQRAIASTSPSGTCSRSSVKRVPKRPAWREASGGGPPPGPPPKAERN